MHLNWRRGGAWGDRAEVPPAYVQSVFLDDLKQVIVGVRQSSRESDGIYLGSTGRRLDWMFITHWMPLSELLDTLPGEKP